ncbi:HNH endonuclease, partial [Paenarthrobacter nicotinovorans]
SNGGLRPQLTVTIDHHDLFQQLTHTTTSATKETNTPSQPRPRNTASTNTRNTVSTGTATFTGPIHPNTIRKIACDADILPVLLGTDSQILDIGRTTRIFPPHIRKAITARDGGCAFPDCTLPAPWCEAHHITYWSQGGTTGTNNATLLCSHHHHLIHKEHWRITIQNGVPWFIPPPHIDPHQTP